MFSSAALSISFLLTALCMPTGCWAAHWFSSGCGHLDIQPSPCCIKTCSQVKALYLGRKKEPETWSIHTIWSACNITPWLPELTLLRMTIIRLWDTESISPHSLCIPVEHGQSQVKSQFTEEQFFTGTWSTFLCPAKTLDFLVLQRVLSLFHSACYLPQRFGCATKPNGDRWRKAPRLTPQKVQKVKETSKKAGGVTQPMQTCKKPCKGSEEKPDCCWNSWLTFCLEAQLQ